MRIPTIKSRPLESPLDFSIVELNVRLRTANILEEAGIYTVRDYLSTPNSELVKVKNFGIKTIEEMDKALREEGLTKPQPLMIAV